MGTETVKLLAMDQTIRRLLDDIVENSIDNAVHFVFKEVQEKCGVSCGDISPLNNSLLDGIKEQLKDIILTETIANIGQ